MPSNKLTMPSISFFILGLVVATVKANETTLWDAMDSDLRNSSTPITTATPIITSINNANTPSIYMNANDSKSTPVLATAVRPGKETPSSHPGAETKMTTPTPSGSPAITASNSKTTTKPSPQTAGSDSTGIIILIVIIIVIAVFLTACYLVHKRRHRYNVDISSRQDEANIPLSTVEPAATAPQNGLTTFGSTEEPEELEAKPEAEAEAQEEQKAQTGSAGDLSAEAATPAPAPDSNEDKPKGDVVEQSPPAPVESTVEEKTDDEAVVSNKTSVESLKETNENNSNNADFSQKRNLIFWAEVPLDCSV